MSKVAAILELSSTAVVIGVTRGGPRARPPMAVANPNQVARATVPKVVSALCGIDDKIGRSCHTLHKSARCTAPSDHGLADELAVQKSDALAVVALLPQRPPPSLIVEVPLDC